LSADPNNASTLYEYALFLSAFGQSPTKSAWMLCRAISLSSLDDEQVASANLLLRVLQVRFHPVSTEFRHIFSVPFLVLLSFFILCIFLLMTNASRSAFLVLGRFIHCTFLLMLQTPVAPAHISGL
jgi:hypothetical protein